MIKWNISIRYITPSRSRLSTSANFRSEKPLPKLALRWRDWTEKSRIHYLKNAEHLVDTRRRKKIQDVKADSGIGERGWGGAGELLDLLMLLDMIIKCVLHAFTHKPSFARNSTNEGDCVYFKPKIQDYINILILLFRENIVMR